MSETHLALSAIRKSWGRLTVLDGVDLAVAAGSFVSLLGPSGCGKTTLLRIVTGSLAPDSGRLLLDGRDITDVPTHRRNMGMVFQSFALFPHLTVAENVAFPMRVRRQGAAEITTRTAQALEMVHLGAYGGRYPRELSGGQQQRVGLARAVVYRPTILLLDEPLSNLDAGLREEMRIEISQIVRRLGITAVYVTHDQREALALSDRIAVMRQGRIVQLGTPEDIYLRPASAFVAGFVGYANTLALEPDEGGARFPGGVLSDDRLGRLDRPVTAYFHASDVTVAESTCDGPNRLRCRVGELAFMGDHVEYVLETAAGFMLRAHVPVGHPIYPRGSEVSALLPAGKLVLVPRAGS